MSSDLPDVDAASMVPTPSRRAVIGPITASVAFVMELTLVPLLLPAIQLQFGLSVGQLAWVFNSYGIAVAVGVLLGGWCGDAFKTERVFGFSSPVSIRNSALSPSEIDTTGASWASSSAS